MMTKAKKEGTTDLATTVGTAVGEVADFSGHAGKGKQNITAEDMILPFLSLVQGNSSVAKVADPKYVDGATEGMFHLSVFNDLFDGAGAGVEIIPVMFEHHYTEWWPRPEPNMPKPDGVGFVGIRQLDDPEIRQFRADKRIGKIRTEKGTEVVETYQLYCMVYQPGAQKGIPATFPIKSTMINAFRSWLTIIDQYEYTGPDGDQEPQDVPMYAHQLRLTSKPDQGSTGDWFQLCLINPMNGAVKDSIVLPGMPRFNAGAKLYEMIQRGQAKADHAEGRESTPAAGETPEFDEQF